MNNKELLEELKELRDDLEDELDDLEDQLMDLEDFDEDEFDVEISDDAAQNIKTVKDIVSHIEELGK